MDLLKNIYEMMDLYAAIKQDIRRKDKHLYERWKAGGFIVDGGIMTMYPTLQGILDDMEQEEATTDSEVLEDGE